MRKFTLALALYYHGWTLKAVALAAIRLTFWKLLETAYKRFINMIVQGDRTWDYAAL